MATEAISPAPPLPQRPHWWSADTAPEAFAVTRSVWLAPAFLVLFVGISALIVPFLDELQEAYVEPLALVTNKSPSELLAQGGSMSFRPFFLALLLLLSGFAAGSWRSRAELALFGAGFYFVVILAVDATMVWFYDSWTPWPFSPVGGIVVGLAGLLEIISSVFMRFLLPAGIKVATRRGLVRLD